MQVSKNLPALVLKINRQQLNKTVCNVFFICRILLTTLIERKTLIVALIYSGFGICLARVHSTLKRTP